MIDGEPVRLYWVKVADQNIDCLVSLEFVGWLASVDAVLESVVVQNHQNVARESFTARCDGHVEGCDGQVQVGQYNQSEECGDGNREHSQGLTGQHASPYPSRLPS